MPPKTLPSITPRELHEELKGPTPPTLIDVRQPDELRVSHLEGARNIPMGELVGQIQYLDREADYVIVCRSGSRSAHVTQFLLEQGFPNVRNLATGINGWARDVDRSKRVY